MSKSGKNPYNVQGVSFESEKLLEEAKARAKSFGLSFSNYICQLVKNDLDDAEAVIVRTRPERHDIRLNDAPTGSAGVSPAAHDAAANALAKRGIKEITGDVSSAVEPEGARIDRKVGDIARRAVKKPGHPEKRGK
jgi:hypothetical protein